MQGVLPHVVAVQSVVIGKRVTLRQDAGLPLSPVRDRGGRQGRFYKEYDRPKRLPVGAFNNFLFKPFYIDLQEVDRAIDKRAADVCQCRYADGIVAQRNHIEALQVFPRRIRKGGYLRFGELVKNRLPGLRSECNAKIEIPGPVLAQAQEILLAGLNVDSAPALFVKMLRDRTFDRIPGSDVNVETIIDVFKTTLEQDVLIVRSVRNP